MAMETHNRVVYEGDPVKEESHEEIHSREERYETLRKSVAGGSALAGIAGFAAIVLAILGLIDVLPLILASVAAIVVGAALLMEGGFSAAWFGGTRERFNEYMEGAFSAELMGGIAGIVLGILALLGIAPQTLLSVAVLALGASLFLASWAGAIAGAKLLVGLASIVLGILGLVGTVPLTLTLVAFLCLGFGTLLSGSYSTGKFMSTTAHA